MARSRLLGANPPIGQLTIEISESKIRVDLGHGRNTASAPLTWQKARSANGDPVRVRYTLLPDGVLKMESLGDGGSGRHTFVAASDGNTLRQDVRVESPHLSGYVRYTLNYRRVP